MAKSLILGEYYKYEDPTGFRPVDPDVVSSSFVEPEIDLTAPASGSHATDSYSTGPVLPPDISMATRVRVTRGTEQTRGTEHTLTLGQLLREAATDPQALADVLQIAQVKAQDASVISACYLPTEDNLLTILAQLNSQDQTARREGALALTHFILHSEDAGLQRGLLATVDEIRTPEARQVLTDVYHRSPADSPLHQWMEALPTHGLYLRSQGQTLAQGGNAPEAKARLGGEGLTLGAGANAGGIGGSAESALVSSGANAALLASLTQSVEGLLNRPEAKALGISPMEAPAIAQRLIEVGANTRPEQLVPTLRAVFMSAGWRQPELSAGNFSQLAGLAEEVAHTAISTFNPASSTGAVSPSHHASSEFAVVEKPLRGDAVLESEEDAGSSHPYATVRGFLGSLVQLAFHEGADPTAPGTATPLSTLAISGMQGAMGSLALANGSAFGFNSTGSGSRPSYYVEGPSETEGDTHQGFGGHSGGGSQGQEEQGEPAQPNSTYV